MDLSEARFSLSLGELHKLSPSPTGHREYAVRYIKAGRIRRADNTPSRLEIPPETIQRAVEKGLFKNRACFLDHAGWFENPSLRDLVGVTIDPYWNLETQSADGLVRLYDGPAADLVAGLLDEILAAQADGGPVPDVGLSLSLYPRWEPGQTEEDPIKMAEIRYIESCDFVFGPGADGRIKAALSSLFPSQEEQINRPEIPNKNLTPLSISPVKPEEEPAHQEIFNKKLCALCVSAVRSALPNEPSSIGNPNSTRMSGGFEMTDKDNPSTAPAPAPETEVGFGPEAQSWLAALSGTASRVMIAASGLPAASKERLSGLSFDNPDEVAAAIEAERAYLAALQQDSVVQIGGVPPRSPHISLGRTGLEQIESAFEAMLSGSMPPSGVQPLSGMREMYHLLSGDYEMTGLYHPDRVYLANVTSATMAGLVANALNKVVVNLFQQYPRWWEKIVIPEDFSNLQAIKWITLGGVGELPTVAEGAAYTELTWDDQTESASFIKKGGYLGITLETIDKDDTRKVQAAPRALAQAAWLTLSKAISAIFTQESGTGPLISDNTRLFTSGHANLGSTALSMTTYNAARLAMRKQTELNSGERLGTLTAPRYLLVPPDLEITALQILASVADYTYALSNGVAAPENVHAQGDDHDARLRAARDRVVIVDLWSDTNDWACVADPRLYPTIGLGFRYGRTPEIFSVASPTAGLMFSNDTMPVKVRFFFATGPMDYRGLYKANVA